MKLNVNEDRNTEISEFYTPLILKSGGSDLVIQLRDNEFEFIESKQKSYIIGAPKLFELIGNYFASKADYFTETIDNRTYDSYHGQGILHEGIAGTPGPGPHLKGHTREENELINIINDYKEDIRWYEKTGEVNLNGSKDLPYQKEYWFGTPSDESKPEIETFGIDVEKLLNEKLNDAISGTKENKSIQNEMCDLNELIKRGRRHLGIENLDEDAIKKENRELKDFLTLNKTEDKKIDKKQEILDYILTTISKNLPEEVVVNSRTYKLCMTFDFNRNYKRQYQINVNVKYIDIVDKSNTCYYFGNVTSLDNDLDNVKILQQVLKIHTDLKQKQTVDELNERKDFASKFLTTDELTGKKDFTSKFPPKELPIFDTDKYLEKINCDLDNHYDFSKSYDHNNRTKEVNTLICAVNSLTHNKPYLLKMVKQITPLILPKEFTSDKGIVKLNVTNVNSDNKYYYHLQVQYENTKDRFNSKPEYVFNFKVLNDTVESNRAIVDRYVLFLDNVLKQLSFM